MPAADEPRLLAKRAELGYVTRSYGALTNEPEAVSSETQELITSAAHDHAEQLLLAEWQKAASRIEQTVAHFTNVAKPPPRVRSDLRVLARCVERVDRQLGR